jgi:phospholipase/carboxylesterase
MLHGATGSARGALRPFRELADDAGLVLLAPDSRGTTWDAIRGDYGPDIAFIDRALASVFQRVAVDPARLTIEGFSDGATYAIGVGLTNGDLFQRVIAFSPGFILPVDAHARPHVFISHGTRDQILPIDQCSRRIVPRSSTRGTTWNTGNSTVPMPSLPTSRGARGWEQYRLGVTASPKPITDYRCHDHS